MTTAGSRQSCWSRFQIDKQKSFHNVFAFQCCMFCHCGSIATIFTYTDPWPSFLKPILLLHWTWTGMPGIWGDWKKKKRERKKWGCFWVKLVWLQKMWVRKMNKEMHETPTTEQDGDRAKQPIMRHCLTHFITVKPTASLTGMITVCHIAAKIND